MGQSSLNSVITALSGIQRLYVDSAPLIYYVEANPSYFAKMLQVVSIAKTADLKVITSVLALAEVLVLPFRQDSQRLLQAYQNMLLYEDAFALNPVTADICILAAEMRARYRLRTPDALHVATAILSHCEAMLTNDKDMTRITELSVLLLDEL